MLTNENTELKSNQGRGRLPTPVWFVGTLGHVLFQ